MTPLEQTYKRHFAGPSEAAGYDCGEYAPNSYASLLWELEKTVIEKLLCEFQSSHPRVEYLDFASGTGRVAAFLEPRVAQATAIEISEAMASRARERLRQTRVLCRDITPVGTAVEGRYDLITAFRFILNAERALRLAALRALASRLRDDTSWLIFNNHGNLWSLKLLGWPYHRLRSLGKGWQPYGNYLRHAQVQHLLSSAGLRMVRVLGLGGLGGTIAQHMPFARALSFEAKLSRHPLFNRFGQNQIYVACRDSQARSASVPRFGP